MSETVIYFFSGTGNSFDIAKRLAAGMPGAKLLNIATADSFDDIEDCKRLGIVFPVYGFTMPNIVKRFIGKMPIKKDAYKFAAVTMGAFALGAMYRTAEAFSAAGSRLDYITNVYMPENYILFSNVPSDKLIATHLNNSVKRVEEISAEVLAGVSKPAKKPLTYMFTQKTAETESAKWKDTAKGFAVSADCTECGKCVRLCPVGNISIKENTVCFSDRCECCLACIHACPRKAIECGEKTAGKKRYINPNINIDDMKKY